MPTNVQNMYAIAHQAKLGKSPRLAAIIEAINVMSQASCNHGSVNLSFLDDAEQARTHAIDIVANANGSPTICPAIILAQCPICRIFSNLTKTEPSPKILPSRISF